MRNPERIDKMLDKIKKIWKENPDLRLGQLIGNCINENMLYFVEDDVLYKYLEIVYEGESNG